MFYLCKVMEMLTNFTVVTISQYMRVSNYQVVPPETCTMLCVNYISIKLDK